jgi:hypothetical protein
MVCQLKTRRAPRPSIEDASARSVGREGKFVPPRYPPENNMSLSISRGATLAAVLALAVTAAGCLQPGSDAESPQNADPSAQRQGDGPEQQQPGQYAPQGQQGQYGAPNQGQYGQPQGQYPQAPNQYGPQGPQGPNQYGPPGPNQYGQSGPPPGQYNPAGPPPGYQQQPPAGPPTPAFGGAGNPNDPITIGETGYLRNQASRVIVELINALPQNYKVRVQDVPLNADPTAGEINAFAACDDQGKPLMAISDGLLQIEANVAAFRATDEIFHTRKLDGYLRMVSANYKPHQPIPRPAPGFVDPAQAADGRKIARQHLLMDEQLAFVLGHELAHHYLGHTGCADGRGGSRASANDVIKVATRLAGHTFLNQGLETAADTAGTNNLLTAGSRHQGAKWSEEGAMLTLEFFSYMESSPEAVAMSFLSTHAHPTLRRPWVQQAANQWRASGGNAPFQFPSIPGLFGGG